MGKEKKQILPRMNIQTEQRHCQNNYSRYSKYNTRTGTDESVALSGETDTTKSDI